MTGPLPDLVSVVIPVRDAAATLGEQLGALEGQGYRGAWEVIVADNGSTDAGVAVAHGFAGRLPGLRVVDASGRRGAAHARNIGAAAARGTVLAFCDADDVVCPDWLAALVGRAHDVDLVGGAVRPMAAGARPGPAAGAGGSPGELPGGTFLRYLFSGNCAVSAAAFTDLGGWNEHFLVGEDVELSWRAQLHGYRLGYAADAVLWRRDPPGAGASARRSFGYGVAGAHLYRHFRDAGDPRSVHEAVRAYGWLLTRAPAALVAPAARRRWVDTLARRAGRAVGSARYRVFYP